MDNNILATIAAGVITGAAIIYFLSKKKNKDENNEKTLLALNWENQEQLPMEEVAKYFNEIHKEVISQHPKAKAIALKVKENDPLLANYIIEKDPDFPTQIILTYFDEEKGEILEKYTKAIRTKSLDINLSDQFSDKEMLVLS